MGQWRKRYQAEGLQGLEDKERLGRPTLISPAIKQQVVNKVCASPPKHWSRWSVRTLAKAVKLAPSVVHLILQEHDLRPHRLRTFNFSPNPCFADKLLEVVGLYMTPPKGAVVLCVDEKTGIHALDRTQPLLPLQCRPGTKLGNEYVRHGTILCWRL